MESFRIFEPHSIDHYIDVCLIHEYGKKNYRDNCFELHTDDLPKHELDEFLNKLMREDSGVRDYVLAEMERLINKRLREVTL